MRELNTHIYIARVRRHLHKNGHADLPRRLFNNKESSYLSNEGILIASAFSGPRKVCQLPCVYGDAGARVSEPEIYLAKQEEILNQR